MSLKRSPGALVRLAVHLVRQFSKKNACAKIQVFFFSLAHFDKTIVCSLVYLFVLEKQLTGLTNIRHEE